jgi:hypothetical protein
MVLPLSFPNRKVLILPFFRRDNDGDIGDEPDGANGKFAVCGHVISGKGMRAWCIIGLTSLYEMTGEVAKAEPLLRKCLVTRLRTVPGEWRTFDTQSCLGGALLGQGKLEEAEPLLLSGYEGLQAQEDKLDASRKKPPHLGHRASHQTLRGEIRL